VASQVIGLVRELAHTVPVLHDVSDGGLAVAIAEICIASKVGATIELGEPSLLFSEDPHRVVAVFERGAAELPGDIARFMGTVGGESMTFGDATVDLAAATDAYRGAIPRRMTS
jgi:phosphoribosylformylglycinamidine synthase